MFVNAGPAGSNFEETKDSFSYGLLVQNIQNQVQVDSDLQAQVEILQAQLAAYKAKFGELSP